MANPRKEIDTDPRIKMVRVADSGDEVNPNLLTTGRPKGYKNIHSKKASQKLSELGFDPLEKLVELHDKIESAIQDLMFDADGNPREKFSSMAHSQLVATQAKVVSDLLRYGYARVTETVELQSRQHIPVQINLTGSRIEFDTSTLIDKKRFQEIEEQNRLLETNTSLNEHGVYEPDDMPMKGKDE